MTEKTLKFYEPLPRQILDGEKKTTWRIHDEKDIRTGDVLSLIRKDGPHAGEAFAKARVTRVKATTFGELDEADWKGHEKFASEKERYEKYSQYYGQRITPDTPLKVIRFELV